MKRICLVILFVSGHAVAAPTVLFNTFGPGDTYDIGSGYTIGFPDWSQGNQFSFTGSTSYSLDTIELATGFIRGTNQIDVFLMSDASGEPGGIIETFSFMKIESVVRAD